MLLLFTPSKLLSQSIEARQLVATKLISIKNSSCSSENSKNIGKMAYASILIMHGENKEMRAVLTKLIPNLKSRESKHKLEEFLK